jgi:hypothetical protein
MPLTAQWIVWRRHWKNIPEDNKYDLMQKLFLLVGFLAICNLLFSQDFILDKRSKIKNKMEKYYADNNRKYAFAETDSTISYSLQDSLSLPATNIFYFNNLSRCIKQEIIFSCDSCMQQSLQQSLSHKFIKWKKIGAESYYAGFPYNALMEPSKVNGRFILRFTWLKRKALKDGNGE